MSIIFQLIKLYFLVLLYLFLGLCQSRQEVVGGDFPSQGAIYPLKGSTNNLYKGEVYSDLHLLGKKILTLSRFVEYRWGGGVFPPPIILPLELRYMSVLQHFKAYSFRKKLDL